MAKICIVVLIGLPATGKTSFCNQLKETVQFSDSFRCYCVTYDDIVGESYHSQYKQLRNNAFLSAEEIIESCIHLQDTSIKHLIVIDDNMYYRSMRYEYYKLAKKHKVSFLQVYLDVQLETALVRNNNREPKLQIPESVIRDMAKKLETPGKEGWELNSLTLNSNSEFNEATYMQFFEILDKSLDTPVQNSNQEKTGPLPISKLQSVDLLLRRIVHERSKEDGTKAAVYVMKKKGIYHNIKDGEIAISETWTETELYGFLDDLFKIT